MAKRNIKPRTASRVDGKQRIQHFVPYLDYDSMKEHHELTSKDQLSTLLSANIASLWQQYKDDKSGFMIDKYKPSHSVKTYKIDCNVPASVYKRIQFLAGACYCSKTAVIVAAMKESIKGLDNDFDLLHSESNQTGDLDVNKVTALLETAYELELVEKAKRSGKTWYAVAELDKELGDTDDDDSEDLDDDIFDDDDENEDS